MQTAADAAAVAAAAALTDGDNVTTAGINAATLNSFINGSDNVTVTINNPPLSGAYSGNAAYVEAIVDQPQPTYFLRALGYTTVDVSTRAVSGEISGPACIYALDPTDSNTFSESGGSSKVVANCGLLVKSDNTSGLDVTGGGELSASSIGVVASSYSDSGGEHRQPYSGDQYRAFWGSVGRCAGAIGECLQLAYFFQRSRLHSDQRCDD
jgi:hypothetical protein